ncbi:hypothetical protein CGZ80_03965 [Rhodopirellula sp. MGV]|nr:hypothetical protein CGZ80_03965 [Rhodopirellula sp. MGV]
MIRSHAPDFIVYPTSIGHDVQQLADRKRLTQFDRFPAKPNRFATNSTVDSLVRHIICSERQPHLRLTN